MGPILLGYDDVEEFSEFLSNYDEEAFGRLLVEGVNHPELQYAITDIMRRVHRVHNSFFFEEMGLEDTTAFNHNLSLLAESYQKNDIFSSQMSDFLNCRRALIASFSGIYELERNYFRIAVMKLVGLTVRVIILSGRVLLDIFGSCLKISPILGHSIRYVLIAASHFGPDLKVSINYLLIVASYFEPIYLISSFVEYLRSKYITLCVINAMEEYVKALEPINNYLSEKDAMQSIVTEMLSQETDEDVITEIEETMRDFEYNRKIFTAILISTAKRNPSCVKDGVFLCKAYRLSRTEEAYEWYNRMSWRIHLPDQEILDEAPFISNRINLANFRVLKDELLYLKMINPPSNQSIQDLIFCLKPLKLPEFVLFGLHSVYLFYNIKKFKHAKNYMVSKDLRKLASKILRC